MYQPKKAKEEVVKRNLFQFMKLNTDTVSSLNPCLWRRKERKVFIVLEKMLTFQSWKQAVIQTCWKLKKIAW